MHRPLLLLKRAAAVRADAPLPAALDAAAAAAAAAAGEAPAAVAAVAACCCRVAF